MFKRTNQVSLLIYIFLSIFFMETLLRVTTTGGVFSNGLVFLAMFTISAGIILYLIGSFFEGKSLHYSLIGLLSITAFVFASQLIYYKTFRMLYTFYSLGNSLQVLQFWRDIVAKVTDNIHWIFLMFLPVFLIVIYGKKYFPYDRVHKQIRYLLIFTMISSHLLGLLTLQVIGKDQNSPYDLYYKNSNSLLSLENLGLLTTMRLDFQRLIFGWSPALEASSYDFYYSSPPDPKANIPDDTDVMKVRIEYNVMDIDFQKLMENESKKSIIDLHNYFSKVAPTAKNPYTGKYKGYNLILITAESFSPYGIHKELTPTLYKLYNEGYQFANFYTPLWGVSTSDGEYVALTSLIPKNGVWSFYLSGNKYMPFAMGNQLKNLGYTSVAYHNHFYDYYRRDVSHPNMGYDYKGVGNGLKISTPWPASDLEMMEKTVDEYINNQPFHAYYMTVSGHMQYNFTGNAMALKNKGLVADLPYSDAAKAYIATQIELDKSLEYLLNKLEEACIADKTLIALSSDHYPYGLEYEVIDELVGHQVERNFELYKNSFLLYTKGMEPEIIDKPASSLDIIPTLSNLLGLEYDSRLLMGRDIFSNHHPLVIFLSKSFITDKGFYNTITKEFIPNDGLEVDEDYINGISSIVNERIYYSAKILETDYYRRVFAQ